MNKSAEPAILTMTLTPYMEQVIKDTFNIEIEMLQGKRRNLKDGRVKYKIEIHDMQKAEMVKEFVLKFISGSHNACKN
jgi:hypothetical protein